MNPASGKDFVLDWEEIAPNNSEERYCAYRLCRCRLCDGTRFGADGERCPDCRAEGVIRQRLSSSPDEASLGLAIVTLANEREWFDDDGTPCSFGLYDAVLRRWLILPWRASPRNVSDAGRVLGSARERRGTA